MNIIGDENGIHTVKTQTTVVKLTLMNRNCDNSLVANEENATLHYDYIYFRFSYKILTSDT